MKRAIGFMVCALGVLVCSCAENADIETEKLAFDRAAAESEVLAVLDQYVTAWKNQDADMYVDMFAHDAELVIFNSVPAVTYSGWENWNTVVHEAFDQYAEAEISYREAVITICPSGDAAWLRCYLDGEMTSAEGTRVIDGIRTTWILDRRDEGWKIVHSHWSMPEPNQ